MKLHRLVLTNYRGIEHREIVLPECGVTVVSGVNEIGKSSMIEAIDLLLECKDRSTKKEVKQVKPTHADVGAEVEAEISSGPYRFVYRKRFHRRCETALSVLAPVREQLTGDEAHERVCAILAETVDTELWRAQRVLQAASTAAVDLSGCDALSRALDVAAGQPASAGDEPVLVDRIDDEYARYFTATGRPTGEWAAAQAQLAKAQAAVAECADAVAEVDDCVRRHAELSGQLVDQAAALEAAHQRRTAARAAAAVVAELTDELAKAEVVAEAARATASASASALAERRRLRADVEARTAAVAELEAEAARAAEEQSIAQDVDEAAANAAAVSAAALADAQARVDAAHAERLAATLERVETVQAELARAQEHLATCAVDDGVLRQIETAAAAVERASDKAQLACARIELSAVSNIGVRVNGEPVSLSAGETWSAAATATTDVEVPGVLTARVIPGASASDTQAILDAAREHLRGLLETAGAADLAGAQAAAQRRRDAVSECDRLAATLSGLCGDETVEDLRARLAALPGRRAADEKLDVDTATTAHRDAIARCQQDRDVAAAAAASLAEKSARATVLRERLTLGRAELESVRQRLAEQRASESDEELDSRVRTHEEQSTRATDRAGGIQARLTEIGAERVEAELADAERSAAELGRQHDETCIELRDLATQLRVYGTEGRRGRLDAAQSAHAHAQNEYDRVGRRARAAQLLRAVVRKHRDDTRLRYVEPFRTEVHRLGRLVFGADFEVEIDSSLRICSRTVNGRTVPYESLSGGAKEQLGIIARLAGAALVADSDRVPVVIDDALGFTDPDRLTKMGAVFGAVGGDAQVLVLTCSPRRYDSIDGAHHIELTA